MVATAEDLSRAGVQLPMLVGGAALSRNFVDKQIAPAYGAGTVAYAQDAMSGPGPGQAHRRQAAFEQLKIELAERREKLKAEVGRAAGADAPAARPGRRRYPFSRCCRRRPTSSGT